MRTSTDSKENRTCMRRTCKCNGKDLSSCFNHTKYRLSRRFFTPVFSDGLVAPPSFVLLRWFFPFIVCRWLSLSPFGSIVCWERWVSCSVSKTDPHFISVIPNILLLFEFCYKNMKTIKMLTFYFNVRIS